MPIYAYRCQACGFSKDVLQKVSDPQLTVCLSCGQPTFKKQLTAAGFQLKGTGWYVTDFKGGAAPTTAPAIAANNGDTPAANGAAGTPAAAPSGANGTTGASGTASGNSGAGNSAAAPSATPTTPSTSTTKSSGS